MTASRIVLPLSAGLVAAGVLLLIGVESPNTGVERPAAPVAAQPHSQAQLHPEPQRPITPTLATRPVGIETIVVLAEYPGEAADAALAQEALHHPDPAVREEAVHALGERGDRSALLTLQEALNDSETAVQEAAVTALTELGGDEAVLALRVALGSPQVAARLVTVDALGQIGGASAELALQQALADPDDVVREAAAEWLDELAPQTDGNSSARERLSGATAPPATRW